LNKKIEEALVFYSEKRCPALLLRARLLHFLGFSRAFSREVLLFSVALLAINHRKMKKEMAIIITKI
jgi:hypothetical protein